MRLNTGGTVSGQAMNAKRPRQSRTSPVRHALALAGLFLLAACGGSETDRETEQAAQAANPAGLSLGGRGLSRVVADGVTSPFSAVAADESRAAEVGRDVLLAGGNAADAAVAMYFAMAVTLPSAASLGASGACIVHNDKTKAAEAFVFPPIAAPGAVARPAVHRAVGRARHHADACPSWLAALGGDGGAGRTAGAVRRAGIACAVARSAGGGGTLGATARRAASSAARHAEGSDTYPARACRHPGRDPPARRRRLLPGAAGAHHVRAVRTGRQPCRWKRCAPPFRRRARRPAEGYGRRRVYVAPAPAAGASALAGWKGQAPGGPTPADSGGFAGLVAVDGKAGAAACSLSMGQTFGARAVVPGVGVLLGAPRRKRGSVSPVIIANPGNGEFCLRRRRRRRGDGGAGDRPDVRLRHHRERPAACQCPGVTGRAGRLGQRHRLPLGLRGSGSSCRSAIDPAGAGLALIAR